MRAEGDTWDIKTSVGSTALFVAAARALAARTQEPLAVDQFAEVFCRAAGGEWAALLDDQDLASHSLLTPDFGQAFQDFQAARTRYFDDYLRTASDAGVRQVVILAAGLDSRAYRLSWPHSTVVYELDRAQVLEFKREVLSEHGATPTAQRHEVAVDLREDWSTALQDNGFDPARPSAWLVEGLLIYLSAEAQDQLFETIDSVSAPGSFVGVEEMAVIPAEAYAAMTEPQGDAEADGTANWARLIYNEPRISATQWFDEHGWNATATVLADYLASLGRAPATDNPPQNGLSPSAISLVTAGPKLG